MSPIPKSGVSVVEDPKTLLPTGPAARRRLPWTLMVVWGVLALLFAYSFWMGVWSGIHPGTVMQELMRSERSWMVGAGLVLPVAGYAAVIWVTRRMAWWRAGLIGLAAWGAVGALLESLVYILVLV